MSSIPPPPATKPEGLGAVITPPSEDEENGAEDYYRRIHASRTVLAMKAVRPEPKPGAVIVEDDGRGAQTLLLRVFAAEKEAREARERLEEVEHERDAARGEVLTLRAVLDDVRAALTKTR